MRILVYLVLGGSVGVLSGSLGIGGGVLLVPLLMWLCGFDYLRAAGTSLAMLSVPVTLLAAWKAYTQDRVDLEAAVCLAVAFAGGGYLGAAAVPYLPADTLRFVFGMMLFYVAARFVLGSHSEVANAAFGLVTFGLALVGYCGLRLLGRRHLTRPELGKHLRAQQERGRGEAEYYI